MISPKLADAVSTIKNFMLLQEAGQAPMLEDLGKKDKKPQKGEAKPTRLPLLEDPQEERKASAPRIHHPVQVTKTRSLHAEIAHDEGAHRRGTWTTSFKPRSGNLLTGSSAAVASGPTEPPDAPWILCVSPEDGRLT